MKTRFSTVVRFLSVVAHHGRVLASLLLLPIPVQAQFTYTTNNGSITITGYNGPGATATVPPTINGLPVGSIANYAFYNSSILTNVMLPHTVTNIGRWAFYLCGSLAAITVDQFNPAYSSETGVLHDKDQTSLIQCPEGKTGSYVIPVTVVTINSRAFFRCGELTGITIPNGVTNIGERAFSDCTRLGSVSIPASVCSLGEAAFRTCSSITNLTIGNNVSSIPAEAFGGCSALRRVTIPDKVTSIGEGAFSYCTSLAEVFIGSGVTDIRSSAFSSCTRLSNVVLPSNVTTIGYAAFRSCTNLGSVTVNGRVSSMEMEAFADCSSLTNVTIADGATIIGDSAFSNCVSLVTVQVPSSITNIGTDAFFSTALVNVMIPNGVICEGAFNYCTSLTNVIIGDGVSSIGAQAFSGCNRLANVIIGKSVNLIGYAAFSYCLSLGAITVDELNPIYCSKDGVLFNKTKTALILCPARKPEAYAVPSSVISIEDAAFSNCTNLTSLTIPNGLTSIGSGAFSRCTHLTSLSIPNSVTNLGMAAFSECERLASLSIPNGVPSLGNYMFYSCSNLTSVTIGASVADIGASAFQYCTRLANVIVPDSVASIGSYAFCGCTSLRFAVLGNGVTEIGMYAFSYCPSLTSVVVGTGLIRIEWRAFSQCPSLTGVYFQGNAPTAGSLTFYCSDNVTVYYVPGTSGWGTFFAGHSTATWHPPGYPPATRYVDANSPNPTPPYTNWATASRIIQSALDVATWLDTIWVTNGVYDLGGQAIGEGPTNRVAMERPVVLISVNGCEVTTIKGQSPPGPGAVRCAYVGPDALLSGFTLTDGATATNGAYPSALTSGGGVLNEGVVSNCYVVGNTAFDSGGGVIGGGTLTHSVVRSNTALNRYGGGVCGGTARYSTIDWNRAREAGGGAAGCTVWNCRVSYNQAYCGGGIVADNERVYNSLINSNRASYSGGGGYEGWYFNCTFIGNRSDYWAGGLDALGAINCIVYFNTASDDSTPNYLNSTRFQNSCTTPLPPFSDWDNNLDADPQLLDGQHISPTSPCLGKGTSGYANGNDLDGQVWRIPPSIGCDEPWTVATPPTILVSDGAFGLRGNRFGFNISGSPGQVIVQASTNLLNWVPLATNFLDSSPFYFSDPSATDSPRRFYRLKSP